MTAYRILGPDGRPLLTSPPSRPQDLVEKITQEDFERYYANEVAKRVRSRGVTMAVVDRDRGRPKPTPVTFDTLRLMAARSEWVRAALNTRKRQVQGKQWSITVKDEDPSGAAAKLAKQVTRLLQRPMMHGSAPQTRTWRQWIAMYVEDLLVLDRACVEKERDAEGTIKALYNVDGATIRPNLDDRGAYHEDAYVQVVDGRVEARFSMEEMICTIENEATDVRFVGYGMSPVESLIVSVTADLHAAKFNSDYFTKGAVPEGILNLGEDADAEDVDAFRIYWLNEVMGRPWSLPMIGGSKAPEFINWRDSNRDMQFMEYQQWLLQKIAAVFGMSPQDFGQIDDVNRSTAENTSEQDDERGLQPLLASIADTINLDVIGEHGMGYGDYLEFGFDQAGESADQINQKFQPMHASGVATGGEWRDAHGMDPDGDPDATHGKEGLRMHLASGEQKPLPNHRDAEVLSASAQQDREDDQADQDRQFQADQADTEHQRDMEKDGGGTAATPWKPADPDDPEVQQAMDDHDRESGIGPRNRDRVGKSFEPGGRDRHPQLTRESESLEDVFDRATDRLVAGITEALR